MEPSKLHSEVAKCTHLVSWSSIRASGFGTSHFIAPNFSFASLNLVEARLHLYSFFLQLTLALLEGYYVPNKHANCALYICMYSLFLILAVTNMCYILHSHSDMLLSWTMVLHHLTSTCWSVYDEVEVLVVQSCRTMWRRLGQGKAPSEGSQHGVTYSTLKSSLCFILSSSLSKMAKRTSSSMSKVHTGLTMSFNLSISLEYSSLLFCCCVRHCTFRDYVSRRSVSGNHSLPTSREWFSTVASSYALYSSGGCSSLP